MIVVLAGASGLVGSALSDRLVADPAVEKVISLARRPSGRRDPKWSEVLVKDLAEMKSRAAELCGDVYFCALGTTIKTAGSQEAFRRIDHRAVVDFGEVAKTNNARAFVLVSASGADAKSFIFYSRVKGETENDLRALGLKGLTIFRPSLLIGERREHRAGEKVFLNLYHALEGVLPTAIRRRFGTDVGVLAEAMLRAGKNPPAQARVVGPAEIV